MQVIFERYSATEIETIIRQRIAVADVDTTVINTSGLLIHHPFLLFPPCRINPQPVFPAFTALTLCAKKVAAASGDIRRALEACREGALNMKQTEGVCCWPCLPHYNVLWQWV